MKLTKILEAKDLKLYKAMLRVFSDYTSGTPITGVNGLFGSLAENGAKSLPSDPMALVILNHIVYSGSNASVINKLLNYRFSDLPGDIRPMIKSGRKILVANWCINDQVTDKVIDLVNWSGKGGGGFWCNVKGEKETVIDTSVEK